MAVRPIAEAAIRITADTRELEQAFAGAERALTSFLAKWISIGAIARAVWSALMEQERALRLVSAELGVGREAAMEYVRSIDQIRLYWGFAREESVRAATNIADAGYSATESAQILEEAMKLAGATGMELSRVADVLASTMRAYGMDAAESARAAENLFYIMAAGRVTLDDLDLGFNRLLVLARPLGIALEELTASYTVMSQKTTETYNIYLALMGVIKAMIQPTKKLQQVLMEHGFASGLAALKTVGLLGVMKILWDEMERGRLRLQDIISDIRAVSGLASITAQDIEGMVEAFQELTGTQTGYDEATRAFMESFLRGWGQAREEFKLLAAEIGSLVLPILRDLTNALSEIAGFLRSVLEPVIEVGNVRLEGAENIQRGLTKLRAIFLAALPFFKMTLGWGGALQAFLAMEVIFQIAKVAAEMVAGAASIGEIIVRSLVSAIAAGLLAVGIKTGNLKIIAGALVIEIGANLLLNLAFKPKIQGDPEAIIEGLKERWGKAFEDLLASLNQYADLVVLMRPPEGFLLDPQVVDKLGEVVKGLEETFQGLRKEQLKPEVWAAMGWEFAHSLEELTAGLGRDFEEIFHIAAQALFEGMSLTFKDFNVNLRQAPAEFWVAFARYANLTLDQLRERLSELGVEIELVSPESLISAQDILEGFVQDVDRFLSDAITKFSDTLAGSLINALLQAISMGEEAVSRFTVAVAERAMVLGPEAMFSLVKAIDEAIKKIEEYRETLGALPPEYAAVEQALRALRSALVETVDPLTAAMGEFRKSLEATEFSGLEGAIWRVIEAISDLPEYEEILVQWLQKEIEARKDQPAQLLALTDGIESLRGRLEKAADILKDFGIEVPPKLQGAIRALSQFERGASGAAESLMAQFRELRFSELEEGLFRVLFTLTRLAREGDILEGAQDLLFSTTREAAEQIPDFQETLSEAASTFKETFDRVSSDLSSSADTLQTSFLNLKGAIDSLAEKLREAGTVSLVVPAVPGPVSVSPMISGVAQGLSLAGASFTQVAQASSGLEQAIIALQEKLGEAPLTVQQGLSELQSKIQEVSLSLGFLGAMFLDLEEVSAVAEEAEKAAEAVSDIAQEEAEAVRKAAQNLKKELTELPDWFKKLNDLIKGQAEGVRGSAAVSAYLKQMLEELSKTVSKEGIPALRSLLEFLATTQTISDSLENFLFYLDAYKIKLGETREVLDDLSVGLKAFLEEAERLRREREREEKLLQERLEALRGAITDIANALGIRIPASVSYLIDSLLGLGSEFDPVVFTIKLFADIVVGLIEFIKGLTAEIERARATLETLSAAARYLGEVFWDLLEASRPYSDLVRMLSFVFGAIIDTLFSFLWPLVAILQELGFVAADFLNSLFRLEEETEEVTEQARTFNELNVPQGFKELAARLEYLVARPGEPWVPEPEKPKEPKPPELPYELPEIKIPEWVSEVIESFRSLIEAMKSTIQFILDQLLYFAQQLAGPILGFLLPVLNTFLQVLATIVAWLNSTALPIIIGMLESLTTFWKTQVEPWIMSQVLPGLLALATRFLEFLDQAFLPFIERYVFPTLQRLWPLVEGVLNRLIDLLYEVVQWLEENWDLVEAWLKNTLQSWERQLNQAVDLWKADMLAQGGEFWEEWKLLWGSENFSFWEKVLLGWKPVADAFEKGNVVMGLFLGAIQLAIGALLVFAAYLVAQAIGSFFGWLLSLIGLQEGGLVTRPTIALVGERGPEAVIPLPELQSFFGVALDNAIPSDSITIVNEIHLEVDGRELAAVIKKQEIREAIIRGRW